jgi:hypothetical protein
MRQNLTIQKGKYFPNLHNFKDSRLLIVLLTGITIEFILFKILYPFPDFFSDSYSYIFAAVLHTDVNVWPIGYSKFLQWFPSITRSHIGLVAFQFYFLEFSALYFFFTLLKFYPLRKSIRRVLILVLFFNPLFLYLSNYVTSDALFIALSLCWISQLMWVVHNPHPAQIIIQGLLIFLAFTVRYNAMYYPIIAAFAFLISRHRPWAKIAGVLVGPLLIIPFVLHSRIAARELTGVAQFPILSGWQWANNALYMREFIEVDSTSFPTRETTSLDRIARHFFETVPQEQRDLPNYVANYFIRQANAPLKQYLHQHYAIHDEYDNLVAWGKVSPIFSQYGTSLIRRYPLSFAQHYLLVNTKNYFLPPLEKLELYNLGQDSIWHRGQNWFSLSTPKIRVCNKYLQGLVLLPYPLLFLLLNLFFAVTLWLLLWRQGFQAGGQGFTRVMVLITGFLILNFGFSVFANIIVIRYQVFPMILLASLGLVSLEFLLIQRPLIRRQANQFARTTRHFSEIQLKTTDHATGN